jgi:UDP-N-acetylglucosamine:LPS N-acetylglucosamine transferase
MGAGHDGAADGLQRCLEEGGFTVDRHDFLDLIPARIGALLRWAYRRMLIWTPGGYQRVYSATEGSRRPGPAVRALLRAAERRTLRTVTADTAAVVSTYPGASQVLGALRRRDALAVPAITYLTDFSVHTLWVAPGIDLHLAVHPIPAAQACAHGATDVSVSGPVVSLRFAPPQPGDRLAARRRFGLPERIPLALLVAGSWGVGALERAAAEIRDSGAAVPVVVCGRNRALLDRLVAAGVQHAYGWVAEMPELMHACDVLVQNAGGLTSLEAFASGLPVASYRCIPGHGRTNAAALREAGLALWIRDAASLAAGLSDLLEGPRGRRQRALGLALFPPGLDPVAAVVAAAERGAADPGWPRDTAWAGARRIVRTGPLRTAPVPRPRSGRPSRSGLAITAAAVAATVTLGIGVPVAEAYGDSTRSFGALTHLFEGERR